MTYRNFFEKFVPPEKRVFRPRYMLRMLRKKAIRKLKKLFWEEIYLFIRDFYYFSYLMITIFLLSNWYSHLCLYPLLQQVLLICLLFVMKLTSLIYYLFFYVKLSPGERLMLYLLGKTPSIDYGVDWEKEKIKIDIAGWFLLQLYGTTLACCCFTLHYFRFGWPLPFQQETIDLALFIILVVPVIHLTIANMKTTNYFISRDY